MQLIHQNLDSTGSISEDNTQTKINNYKEKAKDLLNYSEICEKDITDFALELRENPEFELEVEEKLFDDASFEIFQKPKLNPVFALNLINIISIANFVWIAAKKNIEIFHRILLNLNIMFSHTPNKQQIEYILLSEIPLKFNKLVAEKGRACFKKNYVFDEDYFSYDRNRTQIGLVYEANTISQLDSMFNNKQKNAPTIMYYLNHQKCLDLFEKSIFNNPKNFPSLEYKPSDDFHGYNEIDHSIILKEDVELNQNFIFNIVFENNNLVNAFNSDNNNKNVKLPKDSNIFFEIKSTFDKDNYIDDLKKKSDRFAEAYGSPAYDKTEKKFIAKKREYFLLYNNNREDGVSLINKSQKEKGIDNEVKVLYNSGYVQISSLVSLQNQIRAINNKMDIMAEEKEKEKLVIESQKKELENKINEQKKEFEDKLKEQQNQMDIQKKELADQKLLFKKMDKSNKIYTFTVAHSILSDEGIKARFENIGKDSNAFSVFKIMNRLYLELCHKVIDDDNKIINLADKLIGQFLTKKEEITEFFDFLSLLNEKIAENTFVKCYYESFKAMLLGPNWKDSNTPEDFDALDLFSKDSSSEIMKNILRFIVLYEMDKGLKYQFIEAVLFYVSKISEEKIECHKSFFIYSDKNNLEKSVADFIKSFNKELLDTMMPKL